jgi:glycosyltransferase involved in cell wall biosynthesis
LRLLMTADAAGGVWTYALDLAAGLAPLGVETVLAVIGPGPNAAQRAQAEAVPGLRLHVTGLPLDWLADAPEAVLAAGRSLAALAQEARVDIVHLNSPAHAAGGSFPMPLVAVSHSCTATWWDAVRGGALPEDFAWRADLMRRGALAAAELVVPSLAFGEMTARRYALPRAPVVVHNGRGPLPSGAVPPADAPAVFAFTAGRLWDAGKNIGALDRVAARLDLPVFAAGPLSGPDGTRVSASHLHTPGMLDETALAGWLARRPIYVSLALYEPFGLAVVEAAQAGCPLVLSDISSFRELWDGAAVFVPADDEEAADRAISALAADERERMRLGTEARSRAARYTVEAMAASMNGVYRRVLFQGSAAA